MLKPHTNLVRSREAHPRGCSRAPFPVEVPSIGAAAVALMGMVRTVEIVVQIVIVFTEWDDLATVIYIKF